jgi:hypothetical protein
MTVMSCKKEDPKQPAPDVNESELITTMKLNFTDSLSGAKSSFMFRDLDGDGANPPVIDSILLNKNTTYTVDILLLDESKSAVDTISNEVEEEKDDHIFFFKATNVNISTAYLDKDSKNLPVGLSTKWKVGGLSKGTIQVKLKHQPSIKDGTDKPGDTDIEVSFGVRVR